MQNPDQSNWFKNAFDEDYLIVYSHRDDEEARQQIAFVVEQTNLKKGDWVLDLACGSGRHVEVLLQEGFHVVAMDLSEPLLKAARKRLESCLHGQGGLVLADMRQIPMKGQIDVVISIFTSFGYFNDLENKQVLENISHALKKEGQLILDIVNTTVVTNHLVPHSESTRNGYTIREERRIVPGPRVEKKVVITHLETKKVREYWEFVRLYSFNELKETMFEVGLSIEQTWGDFDGRPYGEETPRLIVRARRVQ